MNVLDINKWKRCEELAKVCSLYIILRGGFEINNKYETLCIIDTIDELCGFLSGYEYALRIMNKLPNPKLGWGSIEHKKK